MKPSVARSWLIQAATMRSGGSTMERVGAVRAVRTKLDTYIYEVDRERARVFPAAQSGFIAQSDGTLTAILCKKEGQRWSEARGTERWTQERFCQRGFGLFEGFVFYWNCAGGASRRSRIGPGVSSS